jgi:phosphatidylglycerophosphate synthase
MQSARVADSLTILRAVAGVLLAFRPSFRILVAGVVSDWLDGPLARRSPASSYGARLDREADSLLTLGAAIAAARRGAPRIVLLAPIARYALASLRPRVNPDEAHWDRVTGVAQMVTFAASIARWHVATATILVSAARTAALAARMAPRGRLDLTAQPAEPR